ncbi:MAG TPA: prepilin-type N-terminal cleavage/methylation domain-containing protein [Polyangiaceae bacterium]
MTDRTARGSQRAFTLIEMMIVVVIVGILAALAVVGYRKIIQSSHVSEATNTVQSIRVAQEAYHAETQQYANISNDLHGSWYPQTNPVGSVVTAWGGPCAACKATNSWASLPLHIDGPVMFGYATVGGSASDTVPTTVPAGMTVTLTQPTTDWFIVAAMCDIDGNGAPNTSVLTTSWSNQVITSNEGQ